MLFGCYAQVAKQEIKKIEGVDIILGNQEKKDIVKYCDNILEGKIIETEKVEDILPLKDFAEFGEITYTEKTRAVIKVQDGCDRFCSYCIIPYARGRVRSRKPENIISEITRNSRKRN